MTERMIRFRDPIHNFVDIYPDELKIIDTPMFQRMRNIKQLSLGHYVYHGAEHSRFGHMIGAMHLAGRAYDALEANSKQFGGVDMNEDDRKTIRMAALLHDVGHPPFSHSLEQLLDDNHERYSQALIDNYFASMIDNAGVDPKHVSELIEGTYGKRIYLSKIVNGQLDVDRMDYLLRDSHYAGVTYGRYDLGRIIEQMCVVDKKFVILEGGYETVEQMIFARYQMYQQVYFQKTKRAFELMLEKCGELLKENKLLDIPMLDELNSDGGQKKFLKFDDRWFLNKIYEEKNPTQIKITSSMIENRQPYIEIYSPRIDRGRLGIFGQEPQNNMEKIKQIQTSVSTNLKKIGLEECEFLVDEAVRSPYKLKLDYISKDKNDNEIHNGEGDESIRIYYINNEYAEPIERRSHIIYTLAKHSPIMMRGFVTPDKYGIIKDFLYKEMKYKIPERD